MKIEPKVILIKDLVENYNDNKEGGVVGYGGKLDIRPPYQREFVYKEKQREDVIKSVINNFPLNSIYWVKNNDKYEVLDGQQRIISISEYINNVFNFESLFFSNQPNDIKEKILDYKLNIYICEGTDSEKLDWFRIINIAGEKLTNQELRNAVFIGPWLSNAKYIFSKSNCAAYNLGKDYINGSPIRQEYLETALKWINGCDEENIKGYMAEHQYDQDANELWQYFQDVINWIKKIFIVYRKDMRGLNWGELYKKYGNNTYNSNDLEKIISDCMEDEEVECKKGIYEYVLSNNEKYLNLRVFSDKQKKET
mgnify:FL=1